MPLIDYKGATVAIGDLVLEERGIVYEIIGDGGMAKEGCAKGRIVVGRGDYRRGDEDTVRLYHTFVIPSSLINAGTDALREYWRRMFSHHVASRLREEVRKRQQETDVRRPPRGV